MTTRRDFLSTLCAAADLPRRQRSWTPFDWQADRPIPPPVTARRPRLWPDATEWRGRASAVPKQLWQPLPAEPYQAPKPQAEGNSGAPGYILLDITAAWLATGNPFYAETAMRTLRRVCEYPHWGGNGKPADTDLHAGALLLGGGVAYDVFREQLSAADRQFILDKMALQARRMFEHHAAREGLGWEQNHTYIDLGGLWATAVALHGEAADTAKWYQLGSKALRLAVYLLDEPDGAFYENIVYWNFGFALHGLPLLDMFRTVTGEDVFANFTAFRNAKYYLMHVLLPGGQYSLNLGDAGPDKVEHANLGRARYAMLKAAAEYRDPECQFLAGYFAKAGKLEPANDPWTLAFWDGGVAEKDPRESWSPVHHFRDLDLVTARNLWGDDATHFALRCGPSVGHRMTKIFLAGDVPKWKPGTGHVHPDLNGFLIFDHGEHLAVDTGYTWNKLTREHSTVAVDGGGQVGDGERWPNYDPLDRYGRIAQCLSLGGEYLYLRGEAANGYQAKLRLHRFDRHAIMMGDPDHTWFLIHDLLESADPHRWEWLLIATNRAQESGDGKYVVRSGKRALTVHLLDPAATKFSQEPIQVTGRPNTVEARGHRLSFALEHREKAEFVVALTLHAADEAGPAVTQRDGVVSVAGERWQDAIAASGKAGAIDSDGHHAMVRSAGGKPVRWAVQNARRMTFEGRELCRASAPVSVVAGARNAVVDAREAADVSLTLPGGRVVRKRLAAGRHEIA